jgi:hypothetical protein
MTIITQTPRAKGRGVVPGHRQLEVPAGDRAPVVGLQVGQPDARVDAAGRDAQREAEADGGEHEATDPGSAGRARPVEGRDDDRVGDPSEDLADRDGESAEERRGPDGPEVDDGFGAQTATDEDGRTACA